MPSLSCHPRVWRPDGIRGEDAVKAFENRDKYPMDCVTTFVCPLSVFVVHSFMKTIPLGIRQKSHKSHHSPWPQ